ncbi:EF-Hand 1, calcium-binding site [Sesbania bispinosa]|nr:EF-Hand 1, calcium-binding site [Sesbania bispinosa]
MGKASIFVYITVAVVVLLFLSYSPNNNHPSHRHRRLKLRSNFTLSPSRHHSVAFDPLVAELERHREDKQWRKSTSTIPIPSSTQPLLTSPSPSGRTSWMLKTISTTKDKFNVTNRLILLFPKIDVDPTDWFVSLHELTQWNLQQAKREVLHRTQREMDLHDKNHDGFVSFSEYDPPSWGSKCSFLHPADSTNPKLQQWLCKEEVRERDTDRDGKVNFKEFFHGLFDLVRNYDEENHNDSHHSDDSMDAPARVLFAQLDKDGDGNYVETTLRWATQVNFPPDYL